MLETIKRLLLIPLKLFHTSNIYHDGETIIVNTPPAERERVILNALRTACLSWQSDVQFERYASPTNPRIYSRITWWHMIKDTEELI